MQDQDEIRTQLIRYVTANDYLTLRAISHFIQIETKTLEMILFGSTKIDLIIPPVERFLNSEGKQLAEIKNSLRSGSGNLIALHKKRQRILDTIKS